MAAGRKPVEGTSYKVVPVDCPSTNEAHHDNGFCSAAKENGHNYRECDNAIETKVYRRRWAMLAIFVLVSMSSAFQWIQFSIITSLIVKYYNVEPQTVDWTSLVYMITYIPLIFPGAWIMDKVGLRITLLMGSLGTAIGAWIKVFGVAPDRFGIALLGQTVVAMSQVFILGVPPNVAAVWFGPEQVSSACSIGVFGNQLGVALGFVLPPLLVQDHEDLAEIGSDLSMMFYVTAGVCTALVLAVAFGFQAKPPLPPNPARCLANEPLSYLSSIKHIITNRNYLLLFLTYGINAGVFYAMSTLLNQTVLSHFPNQEENAGFIGLTIVVCGMLGSLICGVILDRTHKFWETTLVVYALAVAGMLAYTFTFKLATIAVTFVTAGAVGFFMTGYLPVGFEFAAELTYPEPEVTSSGLLNASAQIFGIVLTMAGSKLLNDHGDLVCNATLSGALLFGAILTYFIRPDLRRQKAQQALRNAPTTQDPLVA